MLINKIKIVQKYVFLLKTNQKKHFFNLLSKKMITNHLWR